MVSPNDIWLVVVAFAAAIINGAIGYGFSSLVTPVAIFWFPNKILNPALVVIEVVVNLVMLWRVRRLIRKTWHRANPVIATLLPGVILGTIGLTYLAVNDVRLIVYAVLLPLVGLQLWGFVRPVKNERRGGVAVGSGIGFLYALTTISGPPLALFLTNQGLTKDEFKCTIAQIRVGESSLTLTTYMLFDVFLGAKLGGAPSIALLPYLVVPVLIGVPIGTLLLNRLSGEAFRTVVTAVNGMFISYGLGRTVVSLGWLSSTAGYVYIAMMFAAIVLIAYIAMRRIEPYLPTPTFPSPSAAPLPDPPPSQPPPSPGKDRPTSRILHRRSSSSSPRPPPQ